MVRRFASNPKFRTCGFPLCSVGGDTFPPAALVGEEVGELVLERAPDFFIGEVFKLRIQLNGAGWPPCTAG